MEGRALLFCPLQAWLLQHCRVEGGGILSPSIKWKGYEEESMLVRVRT